jgi:hypothetical protein
VSASALKTQPRLSMVSLSSMAEEELLALPWSEVEAALTERQLLDSQTITLEQIKAASSDELAELMEQTGGWEAVKAVLR